MSNWIVRKLATFGIWVIELGPRYDLGELDEEDKRNLARLRIILHSVAKASPAPSTGPEGDGK